MPTADDEPDVLPALTSILALVFSLFVFDQWLSAAAVPAGLDDRHALLRDRLGLRGPRRVVRLE